MSKSRLEHLIDFYNNDSEDPFNIYALANEYKSFDYQKALEYFELLVTKHPNYVATYYHLAHLYIELNDEDKARDTFEAGIRIAKEKNNQLALRELRNAYDEFTMDY